MMESWQTPWLQSRFSHTVSIPNALCGRKYFLNLLDECPLATVPFLRQYEKKTTHQLLRGRLFIQSLGSPEFYVHSVDVRTTQRGEEPPLMKYLTKFVDDVEDLPSPWEVADGPCKEETLKERRVAVGVAVPGEKNLSEKENDNVTSPSSFHLIFYDTDESREPISSDCAPDDFSFLQCVGENVQMNDVVEFLGIIVAPKEEQRIQSSSMPECVENTTEVSTCICMSPPPRIHVLFHRKVLRPYDFILSQSPTISVPARMDSTASIRTLRQTALHYIATTLTEGDLLAAEYFLLSVTSIDSLPKKESMQSTGMIVSRPVLQLFGVSQFTLLQEDVLRGLLPLVEVLSLRPQVLNSAQFLPQWNGETGQLTRGRLQLPSDCLLVVDETHLEEGPLTSTGVSNLTALASLCSLQAICIDYDVYTLPLREDFPVVIFSDGPSIIRSAGAFVPLPLQKDDDGVVVGERNESEERALLSYFAHLRSSSFSQRTISSEVQEAITETFVSARKGSSEQKDHFLDPNIAQKATSLLSADLLNLWIILACNFVKSLGEDELTVALWSQFIQMEQERLKRLVSCDFKWVPKKGLAHGI